MTRARVIATVISSTLVAAQIAQAQLPQTKLYALFPPGAQAGTQVELKITAGDDLDEVDHLFFTHAGITAVQKTQDVQGKPQPVENTFTVTISADVPPGVYEVSAMGRFGASNPRRFVVSDRPELSEAEANNESAQAAALEFGKVVNGRMEGGTDVDWFKFAAKAGQRLVFDCLAERIDSRMDPTLEVYDASGRRRLRAARNVRGEDAVLVFDVPADGDYLLRLFDHTFRNGNEYVYRLSAQTGPHIAYVLPPAGLPGSNDKYSVFGFNLPGGQMTDIVLRGNRLERLETNIALPGDAALLDVDNRVASVGAGTDAVSWRLDSPQGKSNPVRIFLAAAPVVLEQEPNDGPAKSQTVNVPCDVAGQFGARGDVDVFTFDAKAKEIIWIEAWGERLGGTIDPYLVVDQVTVDGNGVESIKRLTAQDDVNVNLYQNVFDTQTDDANFRLDVPADGKYRVAVRDRYWETRGDPSLVYRLTIRREQPDFRLVAVPVAPQPGQATPVGLRKGDNFAVNVLAFRHDGFDGAIDVVVEDLPPGVICPGTTIGPKQTSAFVVFTAAADAAPAWRPVKLIGRARIDDPAAARGVDAARAAVTEAPKPLGDLRKALATEAEKVQKATAARDAAKTAAADKPDDQGLAKQLEEAQKALDTASAAHQQAAEKLAAAEQAVAAAQQALAQARQAAGEKARDVQRLVRAGTVVWPGQNNVPAESRVAKTLAVSIMPESAPFQLRTDVFRVDANQSRVVLVPVTLDKRNGFDEKVALNFNGVPNNANIEVKNDALEKGQADKLLRIFVKDNATPGTYVVWLATQGQVAYARNPEKAERLKQAHEAVAAQAKTAQENAEKATQAKSEAVQKATEAATALQKAQTDKAAADKNLQTSTAAVPPAQQVKDTAAKQAAEAAALAKKSEDELAVAKKALDDAQQQLQQAEQKAKSAAEALDKDQNNEDLKKQKAEADAGVKTSAETRDKAQTVAVTAEQTLAKAREAAATAETAKTDAAKKFADAETAAKQADEAAKKADEALKQAEAANKVAQEAKPVAEKAEQDAQAAAKALDDQRKAAEKSATDAANAAKPQNKNFTPPSTPIVLVVKPAPVKLTANVPNSGNLKQGEKLEIKVTITRQNNFAGPVTLTLPAVPAVTGVAAENVTVPADQTEGTITVTASADATEGQLPNLAVRATMEFEGQAAVDAPINITVQK